MAETDFHEIGPSESCSAAHRISMKPFCDKPSAGKAAPDGFSAQRGDTEWLSRGYEAET